MKGVFALRSVSYSGTFLMLASLNIMGVHAEPAPAAISFGAGVEKMTENLDGLCENLALKPIDPPQIPGVSEQTQLDCQGFTYFGAPRLAEFVFGDDALTIVWILIDENETDALTESFMATFGEPSHDTPLFTAFTDGYAAVRKDIPEALYYAPFVADAYQGWFDQQAGDQ